MRGLVIKSTGSGYTVRMDDGQTRECYVKGNFRLRGIRSTNPVAIGDYVEVAPNADGTHWITDVAERRNYIIRRSTNLSHASHILAANIDLAALLVTVNHPRTSTTFIDRFLATCEAYRVPACLVFNKIDTLTAEEREQLTTLRGLYASLGYPTYAISALRRAAGADDYDNLLHAFAPQPQQDTRIVLLSGNSGVGKSTLLNALLGEDIARTGSISSAHDKGMHTTTFSEMYPLRGSGNRVWIADTPGIKGFGVLDMQRQEVGHYFREIFRTGQACRYSDCLHIDEPACAVCQAVQDGAIAFSRYESYLSMLEDITEAKYR